MAFAKPKIQKKKARRAKKRNEVIKVLMRVRPLLSSELSQTEVVNAFNTKYVQIQPLESDRRKKGIRKKRVRSYSFDYVFSSKSSQKEVFNHTTKPLLSLMVDEGINSTVFCYGATGSGKTYTMIGDNDQPGLMSNTVEALFKTIKERSIEKKSHFNIELSYFEIYNENIRDLLSDDENSGTFLTLRENESNEVQVVGLTWHEVSNVDIVHRLIIRGNSNRTCEPNSVHEHSSRSHAILQIRVKSKERINESENIVKISKLNLIDLAGSERACVGSRHARGIRQREGANINKSLLALANCINALTSRDRKNEHIPYRDSKLTRLLKDSLSGNCKTIMIATISPGEGSIVESKNTIKYAVRTKSIKTNVGSNVKVIKNANVQDLKEEITGLKDLVSKLKERLKQLEYECKEGNSVVQANRSVVSTSREDIYGLVEIKENLSKNFYERFLLKKQIFEKKNRNLSLLLEEQILSAKLAKANLITPEKKGIHSLLYSQRNKIRSKREDIKRGIKLLDSRVKVLQRIAEDNIRTFSKLDGVSATHLEVLELMGRIHLLQCENYTLKNNDDKMKIEQLEVQNEVLKWKLKRKNKAIKKLRMEQGKDILIGESQIDLDFNEDVEEAPSGTMFPEIHSPINYVSSKTQRERLNEKRQIRKEKKDDSPKRISILQTNEWVNGRKRKIEKKKKKSVTTKIHSSTVKLTGSDDKELRFEILGNGFSKKASKDFIPVLRKKRKKTERTKKKRERHKNLLKMIKHKYYSRKWYQNPNNSDGEQQRENSPLDIIQIK